MPQLHTYHGHFFKFALAGKFWIGARAISTKEGSILSIECLCRWEIFYSTSIDCYLSKIVTEVADRQCDKFSRGGGIFFNIPNLKKGSFSPTLPSYSYHLYRIRDKRMDLCASYFREKIHRLKQNSANNEGTVTLKWAIMLQRCMTFIKLNWWNQQINWFGFV